MKHPKCLYASVTLGLPSTGWFELSLPYTLGSFVLWMYIEEI